MVYASIVSPGSGVNVEQFVLTLHEEIDEAKLAAAWRTIVGRHEVLRSRVELPDEGEPVQVIDATYKIDWTFHDWQNVAGLNDKHDRLAEFLALDRRKEFNWRQGPLTRINVFCLARDRAVIVWTFHHVLLDGRSIARVVREWFTIYESLLRNEVPRLMPAGDFGLFAQEVAQAASPSSVEFWRARLAGVEPQTLPQPCNDSDPSAILASKHTDLTIERDEVATHQLRTFADECGVTMHALVQAAWSLTLNAFTGQTDIVFGSVRACRHTQVAGVESMVGMLINTIPFRVQLDGAQRIDQLLQQIRQQQVDLRDHETVGLEECHRCSGLEADQPLVRTVVMFENVDLQTELQRLGGAWSGRSCELLEKTDLPLTLAVHHDEKLSIHLEYSTACYEPQAARAILEYFVYALDQLRKYASRPIGQFPSLTPEMQMRVMQFTAGESRTYPHDTLCECFAANVVANPEVVAICDGDESITYRELNARANGLAERLIERGAKPGQYIGLALSRSIDMYVAVIAIIKTGAAYLPLDPKYPQDRLRSMIDDAQPVVVITNSELRGSIPVTTERILIVDAGATKALQLETTSTVSVRADDPAIVIFTSGTTGRPKGVMLTQRGIANSNQFMISLLELRAGDRSPQVASINFDVSIEEIFCTLNSGATLVIPPTEVLDSVERFLLFVASQRLTVLNLSTQLWRELVRHCDDEGRQFPDCVRLVIVGGERTPRETYQAWLRVGGARIRWMNGYGPSEACPMSTTYIPKSIGEPLVGDPPIGRPIANWNIYVLDGWQRPVPIGAPGELYVGGVGVARGYLKRRELTAERFVTDPFQKSTDARMYRTGDRVRWRDDGQLDFFGRVDTQIKLRGFRIEPGEIETALMTHEAVAQALVKLVTTPAGHDQLVGYVVPRGRMHVTASELLEHLQTRVPGFMIPNQIVLLEVFPRTNNGKIDQRALPDPLAERSFNASRPIETRRSPLAVQLAKAWAGVLGLSQVADDDDFFALGGDSLRAMRITAKVESLTGAVVSLATLASARTFGKYVAAVERQRASAVTTAVLLREGTRDAAVFLAPSLCGDVFLYRHMVDALQTERAIWGLQLRGIEGREAIDESVEAVAADAVRQIRIAQSRGPYRIAGYSSGGMIAYEIARQLTEAGESVALLALIDSALPALVEQRHRPSRFEFANRFLHNLPAVIVELLAMDLSEIKRRLRDKIRRPTPNAGTSLCAAPSYGADEDLREYFHSDLQFFSRERIAFIRQHLRALNSYDPIMFHGDAVVLRTARQPLWNPQDDALGWRNLVRGHVQVSTVWGRHADLLKPGHVAVLAKAFERCLQRG